MLFLTLKLDYPKNVCAKIQLDEKEDKKRFRMAFKITLFFGF